MITTKTTNAHVCTHYSIAVQHTKENKMSNVCHHIRRMEVFCFLPLECRSSSSSDIIIPCLCMKGNHHELTGLSGGFFDLYFFYTYNLTDKKMKPEIFFQAIVLSNYRYGRFNSDSFGLISICFLSFLFHLLLWIFHIFHWIHNDFHSRLCVFADPKSLNHQSKKFLLVKVDANFVSTGSNQQQQQQQK